MKRVILLLLLSTQLIACAGMKHNQIRAEQAKQEAELNLPAWATAKPERKPVKDAVNGAAWWIAADKIKEALNK